MKLLLSLLCLILLAGAAQAQPAAPSGLTATNGGVDRIDLGWTDNASNEVSFRIERATSSGGTFREIGVVSANAVKYYDLSARPNTAYYYKIRARNGAGNSAYTAEATATTSAQGAPTASITVASTVFTDEVITADATASTNVSKWPISTDKRSPVTVDWGDGFTCGLLKCTHLYRTAGSYTVTLTVKNYSGTSAQTTSGVTVSDIPAATGGSSISDACLSGGTGNNVQVLLNQGTGAANKTCLQNAIDRAATRNASEQEVTLPAGATYSGAIVLTTPNGGGSGSKYITIKSASLASLTRRKRVGAGDVSNLPIIQVQNAGGDNTVSGVVTPVTSTSPTHHYRLQGIRISKASNSQRTSEMFAFGDHNLAQDTQAEFPHHLIADRIYIDDGFHSNTAGDTHTGMRVAADSVTIVDSYIDNMLYDVGADSVAIAVSKGQGFAFWNNYLGAVGENFYLGSNGVDQNSGTVSSPTNTSATLSATTNLAVGDNIAFVVGGAYGFEQTTIVRSISGGNITFDPIPKAPDNSSTAKWAKFCRMLEMRHNHLKKGSGWISGVWSGALKNLWETKSLTYGTVAGNVMENNWIAAQQGVAFVITARKSTGGEHEATAIRHLEFVDNMVRNSASSITIMSADVIAGQPTQLSTDLWFRNNLFVNIGQNWQTTGGKYFLNISEHDADNTQEWNRPHRLFILHNTEDWPSNDTNGSSNRLIHYGTGAACGDCVWANNIWRHLTGVVDNDGGTSEANVNQRMGPGATVVWHKNMVTEPGAHVYPTETGATLLPSTYTAQFTDHTNQNFTLDGASTGKSQATEGGDVGVDTTALKTAIGASSVAFGTATIKATTGDWSTAGGPTVCSWHTNQRCVTP